MDAKPPSLSRRRHAPKGPIKAHDHMDGVHHMDVPRCTARAKGTGERCKRRPIPGGTVCVKHGGGAPQVKDAALERLRALQYPAVSALAELIDLKEFPTVRLGASKDILDRTLGKAIESINVDHTGEIAFRWLLNDESS